MGSIGGLHLPGMELPNQRVAVAVDQMTRMQSGGSSRTLPADIGNHFSGIDTATKRISANMQAWQIAAARARDELKQLNSDIRGLEKASLDPSLKASTRSVMLDEIQQLEARRKEVTQEISKADTRRGKVSA